MYCSTHIHTTRHHVKLRKTLPTFFTLWLKKFREADWTTILCSTRNLEKER